MKQETNEGRKHSLNLAFGKELLELGKLEDEELIADVDGIKRIKIAIFKNFVFHFDSFQSRHKF